MPVFLGQVGVLCSLAAIPSQEVGSTPHGNPNSTAVEAAGRFVLLVTQVTDLYLLENIHQSLNVNWKLLHARSGGGHPEIPDA